jgi:phytanoyl-CoA hydroxylase
MRKPPARFEFDEEWYLRQYPDVAEAVRAGTQQSGLQHYLLHGLLEGRRGAPGFDAEWYARAYPLVLEEADAGSVESLYSHYCEIGRHRGYLPYAAAPRPANAAGIPSPFGGLWIDAPNALDLIAGKYEIGAIDRDEAGRLTDFVRDGYVIFRSAVAPDLVERADQALEAAYSGEFPDLRFECPAVCAAHTTWDPRMREAPAKALDLHWFSEAIRDLIFCRPVVRFLELLFERPALASQTLGFYRGSQQPLHQDSAYVPYTLPRQMAASWIALEDAAPGAGELEYLPGSHRELPEFTYPGDVKSVVEAQRAGVSDDRVVEEARRHEAQIRSEGLARNLRKEGFRAKRGDVLFWHADLAHGGAAISKHQTRKSIVTHYCPKEVCPLYVEAAHFAMRQHAQRSYYLSSNYGRVAE